MNSLAAQLKSLINGYVIEPEQVEYGKLIAIDNGRIERQPAVIALVHDITNVQKVVAFAREHTLKLTVKGGGHSAAGYCLNDGGIVVDLSLLKNISLSFPLDLSPLNRTFV